MRGEVNRATTMEALRSTQTSTVVRHGERVYPGLIARLLLPRDEHSGAYVHDALPSQGAPPAPSAPSNAALGANDAAVSLDQTGVSLELPAEIWGEVMQFSSRDDVLNLRASSRELQSQADLLITELLLDHTDAIVAFADSGAFPCVETLHLHYADNRSLRRLSARMAANPDCRLAITLLESFERLGASGVIALHCPQVSRLTITGALFENTEALRTLQRCPFPVDLDGYFSTEALASTARIPTLRKLCVHARDVNDEIASWFSGHAALQSIDVCVAPGFSSRGIGYLMTLPRLRSLRMQYNGALRQIDAGQAEAMAASTTLEALYIVQHMPYQARYRQPFSEAGLIALAQSRTLKTLTIPTGDAMHRIADMTALEDLTLSGGSSNVYAIDVPFAERLCQMPNLRVLWLDTTRFDGDAMRTIFAHSAVRTLRIKVQHGITRQEMDALLNNTLIQELLIDRNTAHGLFVDNHNDLLSHATLVRLRIGDRWYGRASGVSPLSLISRA